MTLSQCVFADVRLSHIFTDEQKDPEGVIEVMTILTKPGKVQLNGARRGLGGSGRHVVEAFSCHAGRGEG